MSATISQGRLSYNGGRSSGAAKVGIGDIFSSACYAKADTGLGHRLVSAFRKFDESQPRDDDGRWTSVGGDGASAGALENEMAEISKEYGRRSSQKKAIVNQIYTRVKDRAAWKEYEKAHGQGSAESRIAGYINQWAESSGDHSPGAVAMQGAAAVEFGLKDVSSSQYAKGTLSKAKGIFEKESGLMQSFLRAQYENTQDYFASKGITELCVARGADGLPLDKGTKIVTNADYKEGIIAARSGIQLAALSSYSTSANTAAEFSQTNSSGAPKVAFAKVPVARILATSLTGFGCIPEREVVVLGGKTVQYVVKPSNNDSTIVEAVYDALRTNKTRAGKVPVYGNKMVTANAVYSLLASSKIGKFDTWAGDDADEPDTYFNIDELLSNADWPKRTPDRMSDLEGKTEKLAKAGIGDMLMCLLDSKAHTGLGNKLTSSLLKFDDSQPRDEKGRWTAGMAGINVAYAVTKPGIKADKAKGVKGVKGEGHWVYADGKNKGKPLSATHQQQVEAAGFSPTSMAAKLNPQYAADVANSPHGGANHGAFQSENDQKLGKWQVSQNEAHIANAKDEKFARVREFDKMSAKSIEGFRTDMPNAKYGDEPIAAYLMTQTGFRVGSGKDTGAEEKAYGVTDLLASHVKVTGDSVKFAFPSKSGGYMDQTIKNADLANFFSQRLPSLGKNDEIFNTNSNAIMGYIREKTSIDSLKNKDIRTWQATTLARETTSKIKIPKTQDEFATTRIEVGKTVAVKLGHIKTVTSKNGTVTESSNYNMSLDNYIDPLVFKEWEKGIK